MKAHRYFRHTLILITLFTLTSCSKDGTDFIDNTGGFNLNSKSAEDFTIVTYNTLDSIRAIRNTSVIPFGTNVDPNFGTFRSSFYASYQTTLTSKSFGFSSVDSIALILPYFRNTPKYGAANQPFSIEVYEMTEGIETDPNSKKISYSISSLPLGKVTNFTPNPTDSVLDGESKIAPAIRVPLDISLANKIVAPGSYASDADFQNILKGLYVRSAANSSTNGYIMLSISSDNILRIYGKNTNGTLITADFTTGGNSSTTVNEFLHDNTSVARNASLTANTIGGDNIVYSHGLNGYVPILSLPDLSSFAKDKSIFKAELSIFVIDSGVFNAGNLGLMYLDSTGNREFPLPDELHKKGFLISVKDTLIGGQNCKEYKYNIGMHINRVISNPSISKKIRLYSAPLFLSNTVTKFSDFIPSSKVIGGTGNMAKPKLKLYYTDI